jgi:MFS family permease
VTVTAAPTTGSQTFRALRHRNARIYFAGLLVSNIGTWLQLTAMSLLVYDLTGKSTDLGITVALQFLPMLVLGAWAGAVADRRDKRTLALLTQSLLAVQAIVLGVVVLAGLESVGVIWTLTFGLGVLNAFENPARRGLVTELVEPPDIANATSLNTAVMTGSRIFGPALGAFLVGLIGSGWCFVLNGVSFVAVLVSLLLLDRSELHTPPLAPRGGRPVRDALSFVGHRRQLLVTFVVMTVVSTFAFNYGVALPKLADQRWGGEVWFGVVLSATSIGSFIGSLLTARMAWVSPRWYLANVLLLGVAGIGMAWAPNVVVALLWSLPLGIGGGAFISAGNGITQQESPPDMRGRLLALTAVAFLGSTPIGGPITGAIGDHVGAEWALAYGSVIAVVTAVAGAAFLRARPSRPGAAFSTR